MDEWDFAPQQCICNGAGFVMLGGWPHPVPCPDCGDD